MSDIDDSVLLVFRNYLYNHYYNISLFRSNLGCAPYHDEEVDDDCDDEFDIEGEKKTLADKDEEELIYNNHTDADDEKSNLEVEWVN